MKLMIASHYPLEPSRPVGGQDVVTQRLLRGLQAYPEINIQVFAITKGSSIDRTWVQDGATLRVASSQKRRYVPRTFSDDALTVSAIRLANPDIVHVHTLAYAYAAVKSGRKEQAEDILKKIHSAGRPAPRAGGCSRCRKKF